MNPSRPSGTPGDSERVADPGRIYPGDALPFFVLSGVALGLWWTPAERILLSRAELCQWLQIEGFVLAASTGMAIVCSGAGRIAERQGEGLRLRDLAWIYLIQAGGVGIFVYLGGSWPSLLLFLGSSLSHAFSLYGGLHRQILRVVIVNFAGLAIFGVLGLVAPLLPLPAPHPPYPQAFGNDWKFTVAGHVALAWAAMYCLAFGIATMFRERLFQIPRQP